ncbi:CAP domain-containing protein [Streptomyces sp. 5-8]|uniref:CAP domain-containing protein n=1 Tax=Streptomyces musisoli TaxID=2802280 RepID=A0ABS1P277_9ACTN|nr:MULTISPECIES: CAP domain-containing protein [Streptomyces]MBL1106475.1 CAP domain-containing protein [Streptomyces musisoli]MBY8840726.1 CAP domain-containing protein [Streptomyces sp. SP2-10]
MGQHRKTKHYRRIVIAVAAMGAVGVPSVALACSDWPSATDPQSQAALTSAPVVQWQHTPGHHHRNGVETVVPTTAPRTAAPKTTAPARPPVTVHPRAKKKVTVLRPQRTTAPSAPKATTAPVAPKASAPTAPKASTPTTPKASSPSAPSTPKPATTASGVTAEILQLVNAERGKAGCQPLTLNATLTKAAQAHSADMAAHQNMSHTGSDGSNPGDRITRAGYTWSSYGENVAYGYSTAQQVMAGWMSSPGHRANILNCGFKEIGVGLAQPGSYWTQDFGTSR